MVEISMAVRVGRFRFCVLEKAAALGGASIPGRRIRFTLDGLRAVASERLSSALRPRT
jgi:hypothetical protein